MAGVSCTTVTPSRAAHPGSQFGSAIRSGSGMLKRAPSQSGVRTSRCSGSCASAESMLKRSSGPSSKRSCHQGWNWDRGPRRPATALGAPVEPEVKLMQARSSGPVSSSGGVAGSPDSSPAAATAERGGNSSRSRGASAARASSTAGGGSPAPCTASQAAGRAMARYSARRRGG